MSSKEDWPDESDALIAAPEYHRRLFENEFVRVLDTNVPPGKIVPLPYQAKRDCAEDTIAS